MPNKKPKRQIKFFFKIPIGDILKHWLEKGELTEEEIAEKIEFRQFTVICTEKDNKMED